MIVVERLSVMGEQRSSRSAHEHRVGHQALQSGGGREHLLETRLVFHGSSVSFLIRAQARGVR